ncbi:MAG TPA: hypothetical protein VL994_06190 [Steroidobacteraceae bacterium]|nr:hypothetical protein [Steroidobacteraceae bacterium]
MKLRRVLPALGAALALAPAVPAGESLYVVEQVVVAVNSTADGNGERVATVKSGDRVELIERAGEAVHVRLPDGREGWLRAIYLSGDEPLRPRLQQSEAELARLKAQLAQLQGQLAAASTPASPAPAAADPAPGPVPMFSPQAASPAPRPWAWITASALAALVLGFLLGWRTLDRRIRRKYGGLKIY